MHNFEPVIVSLFFKNNFIYLFLAVLDLCCCARLFSSCGKWGLLSSCSVQASLCGGFSCCRARALGRTGFSKLRHMGSVIVHPRLSSASSIAVVHRFSCTAACLPRPGIKNLCLLRWQVDSLPMSHQGSPEPFIVNQASVSSSIR